MLKRYMILIYLIPLLVFLTTGILAMLPDTTINAEKQLLNKQVKAENKSPNKQVNAENKSPNTEVNKKGFKELLSNLFPNGDHYLSWSIIVLIICIYVVNGKLLKKFNKKSEEESYELNIFEQEAISRIIESEIEIESEKLAESEKLKELKKLEKNKYSTINDIINHKLISHAGSKSITLVPKDVAEVSEVLLLYKKLEFLKNKQVDLFLWVEKEILELHDIEDNSIKWTSIVPQLGILGTLLGIVVYVLPETSSIGEAHRIQNALTGMVTALTTTLWAFIFVVPMEIVNAKIIEFDNNRINRMHQFFNNLIMLSYTDPKYTNVKDKLTEENVVHLLKEIVLVMDNNLKEIKNKMDFFIKDTLTNLLNDIQINTMKQNDFLLKFEEKINEIDFKRINELTVNMDSMQKSLTSGISESTQAINTLINQTDEKTSHILEDILKYTKSVDNYTNKINMLTTRVDEFKEVEEKFMNNMLRIQKDTQDLSKSIDDFNTGIEKSIENFNNVKDDIDIVAHLQTIQDSYGEIQNTTLMQTDLMKTTRNFINKLEKMNLKMYSEE